MKFVSHGSQTYPEAHALLACWGMHLDFGPDVSGGALFPFLEAFTDMRTGISLARKMSEISQAWVPMILHTYGIGNAIYYPWVLGYWPSQFGGSRK